MTSSRMASEANGPTDRPTDLPYFTLPYPTLPSPTLPYPTLPYLPTFLLLL